VTFSCESCQWYGDTPLIVAKDFFSGFAVSMFPSK
jgi:hypothetical protein